MTTQNLQDARSKSSSKTEVYSSTIQPQEIKITSNRWPKFTHQTTGEKKELKKNPKLVKGKKS